MSENLTPEAKQAAIEDFTHRLTTATSISDFLGTLRDPIAEELLGDEKVGQSWLEYCSKLALVLLPTNYDAAQEQLKGASTTRELVNILADNLYVQQGIHSDKSESWRDGIAQKIERLTRAELEVQLAEKDAEINRLRAQITQLQSENTDNGSGETEQPNLAEMRDANEGDVTSSQPPIALSKKPLSPDQAQDEPIQAGSKELYNNGRPIKTNSASQMQRDSRNVEHNSDYVGYRASAATQEQIQSRGYTIEPGQPDVRDMRIEKNLNSEAHFFFDNNIEVGDELRLKFEGIAKDEFGITERDDNYNLDPLYLNDLVVTITNLDAPEAQKVLKDAFIDPVKGITLRVDSVNDDEYVCHITDDVAKSARLLKEVPDSLGRISRKEKQQANILINSVKLSAQDATGNMSKMDQAPGLDQAAASEESQPTSQVNEQLARANDDTNSAAVETMSDTENKHRFEINTNLQQVKRGAKNINASAIIKGYQEGVTYSAYLDDGEGARVKFVDIKVKSHEGGVAKVELSKANIPDEFAFGENTATLVVEDGIGNRATSGEITVKDK